MKFSVLLAAHKIPEWTEYYVKYDALKDLINQLQVTSKEKDEKQESCWRRCCRTKVDSDDVRGELTEQLLVKDAVLSNAEICQEITESYRFYSSSRCSSREATPSHDGIFKRSLSQAKASSKELVREVSDEISPIVSQTCSAVQPRIIAKATLTLNNPARRTVKSFSLPQKLDLEKSEAGACWTAGGNQEILASWIAKIADEQEKVSRFYRYMLGVVTQELEFVQEQTQRWVDNPLILACGDDSNYYDNEGIPLDSPKGSRRRQVFGLNGRTLTSSRSLLSSPGIRRLWTARSQEGEKLPSMRLSFRKSSPSSLRVTEKAYMREAIYTMYQRIIALQNFVRINAVAITMICKKFDRRTGLDTKQFVMEDSQVKKRSHTIHAIEKRIVDEYAEVFEFGNVNKAKVHLMNTLTAKPRNHDKRFWIGLKMGIILSLGSWVFYGMFYENQTVPHHCIYVYRSFACLVYGLWLWGFNVFIWTKYRINYAFAMDFDPRSRQQYYRIFDKAANMTLVFLVNLAAYLHIYTSSTLGSHFTLSLPYGLMVYLLIQLFLPIECCVGMPGARPSLWSSLWNILIAPAGRVSFRDTFVADILTSLVKVFSDLYMATCLGIMEEYLTPKDHGTCHWSKTTGLPIVICIPYYFRFMQCINLYYNSKSRREKLFNFLNALKYSLTMLVTLLSSIHGSFSKNKQDVHEPWFLLREIWLVLTICSTLFTYLWDNLRDWGLWRNYRGLRSELKYPVWWYYAAIVLDLIGRFMWILTLMPTTTNPYYINTTDVYFVAAISCIELTRRSMWAVFRVENEHISKMSEFNQFLYVPMLFSTQAELKRTRILRWDYNAFLQVLAMVCIVGALTTITVLTN